MSSVPVTLEEVKKAVTSMGAYKAPGPDGFQPVFYQHCLDTIIGSDLIRMVQLAFETATLENQINATHLVLIPKTQAPQSLNQYRPIRLCNVA